MADDGVDGETKNEERRTKKGVLVRTSVRTFENADIHCSTVPGFLGSRVPRFLVLP